MAKFDNAFKRIIKAEGGYSFDKNDKGGETYLGISRKYHSNSEMWKYVDEIKSKNPSVNSSTLTKLLKKDNRIDNIVKEIYKKQYWDILKCDKINSQKLAEQLFDMGVNAGTSTAIKLMQRITGQLETGYTSDKFIESLNNYSNRIKYKTI